MGKPTKRERKFNAKGGVKARLEKGTVTSKGKLKRRKRRPEASAAAAAAAATTTTTTTRASHDEESKQKRPRSGSGDHGRTDDGFLGEENLGDLDMDSFFSKFAESIEREDGEKDDILEDEGEEVVVEKKASSSERRDRRRQREQAAAPPASSSSASKKKRKVESAVGDGEGDSSDESGSKASESESESDEEGNGGPTESLSSGRRSKRNTPKRKNEAKGDNDKGDSDTMNGDSSDSDDDDVEAAESRMKKEMAKMERDDPDFHKFLKENEESLLQFGQEEGGKQREEEDEDEDEDHDDDEDRDVDDDEDGEKATEKKKQQQQNQGGIHLTAKVLESLRQGTFRSHGVRSLKRLVGGAYRSACHLADSSSSGHDGDGDANNKTRPGESGAWYFIDSSEIFDELMVLCLSRCHEEFRYHLLRGDAHETGAEQKDDATSPRDGDDDNDEDKETEKDRKGSDGDDDRAERNDDDDDNNKPLNPKVLERAAKWPELRPILLSFFRSTLHVMSEAKEPELLTFILKALSKYVRFLTPFPRVASALLKSLTGLWSAPLDDSSEDYQVVRLNAFFRIRQLAITQPFPFIEECLKKTYLAYAKRSKFASGTGGGATVAAAQALPTLTFMGNCLVELYSLDDRSSYQHAFVYIRQLALLLRSAMQKKTPESVQQVYCWQYLHCLKLWVAVLAASVNDEGGAAGFGGGAPGKSEGGDAAADYDGNDNNNNNNNNRKVISHPSSPRPPSAPMRSLVYPLTEVILGAARWIPSPVRHLPFRFHCVRLLQQLAAASEQFVPTSSLLLECLDWKEWYLSPKKTGRTKRGGGRGGSTTTAASASAPMIHILKLSRKGDALRTHEELESATSEWFSLMEREVELYRYAAGFPEYSIPIAQRLRRFAKDTRNARWRSLARGCIETCQRYSVSAASTRAKLIESPKDVSRLECLRPADKPTMGRRHETAVAKERKALERMLMSTTETARPGQAGAGKAGRKEGKEEKANDHGDGKEKEGQEEALPKKTKGGTSQQGRANNSASVLEEEDQVQEGIDWSDDEDEVG